MTDPGEEKRKEAFRLFEAGEYQESLRLCTELLEHEKDTSVGILAATNLFHTERFEDAEVHFRDLARKMPGSSYVHSYLAKVLEAEGNEEAITEYATAVRLDPGNQDALRSYARHLLGREDYRSALPVLRRIVAAGPREGDRADLMRALIGSGETAEALLLHEKDGGSGHQHAYLDALILSGRYRDAYKAGIAMYRETGDPDALRSGLDALARYDRSAAQQAYAGCTESPARAGILCDYLLFLKTDGEFEEALTIIRSIPAANRGTAVRLIECEILAGKGDNSGALAAYEALIRDEIAAKNDMDLLARIICRYRRFITGVLPAGEAKKRFLSVVSGDPNVACLLETARLFHNLGETDEARAWYYRAYRSDYLSGGPPYARFLLASGDDRECEKVVLYLLANARRGQDLIRVASVILDERCRIYRFRRVMEQLVTKLFDRRATLDSAGLEILSDAFFIMAANALEEEDFANCKYCCLCGMDLVPSHPKTVGLEDFLRLIRECKERSVADRPVMHPNERAAVRQKSPPPARAVADELSLTDQEQKIVSFLRTHRKATEMDLRTLLETRRVAGLVNRIIQKAAAGGMTLIEKKGIGDNGEIYEYTGT